MRIYTRAGGLAGRVTFLLFLAALFMTLTRLSGWLALIPMAIAAGGGSYLAWDYLRNYVEIDQAERRIRIVSRSGIVRELVIAIPRVDYCRYDGARFELAMVDETSSYRFNVIQLGDRAIRAIIDALERYERSRGHRKRR